jgi:flavin reductase (DIM6/NTAB) family NADH-FMN oxidoreductase RutF
MSLNKTKIANFPIGPFPVALAGADVDGKPNYTTVGACGVVCQEPVLYVSLMNTHHTTAGVKSGGYFSLNIPSANMVQETDYCGIVSGKETDKSGIFKTFYDDAGRAPLIEECPLNFLCEVFRSIEIYDFTMFLGKIRAVYINQDCLTGGKPDPLKINPLVLMGTGYFNLKGIAGTIYKEGKKRGGM